MARIRKLHIENYRGIKSLEWTPTPGINCLIGPGDTGKSTVLDGIESCLRPRRFTRFTDADFHNLDVRTPIRISVTLGELEDRFLRLEQYGLFLRSFDSPTGNIEDEPRAGTETVVTVRLTVTDDLIPSWHLYSQRAESEDSLRNLAYRDALDLAPTRLGNLAEFHLGWREGSVLNRISAEDAPVSAALADAARGARIAFGTNASGLQNTLTLVEETATSLGISIRDPVAAMLDPESISLTGGSISVHDAVGIPLRGLGTGSLRLLIAGLQAQASRNAGQILIDELEYGLEPHRIIRLLEALGAKDDMPPAQVIMTTHSPVVLRELSGAQLFATRPSPDRHVLLPVGGEDLLQSTIRSYPEAFLAPSIILCEGATEVGLLRGLNRYKTELGQPALSSCGAALVDYHGGDADEPFKRALALLSLGYRVAILQDSDKPRRQDLVDRFNAQDGRLFAWRGNRALEDELFGSLTPDAVLQLVDAAIELNDEEQVRDQVLSASNGTAGLDDILSPLREGVCDSAHREILGSAAKSKRQGWFKTVTKMQSVAYRVVAPAIRRADPVFRTTIRDLFSWARDNVS